MSQAILNLADSPATLASAAEVSAQRTELLCEYVNSRGLHIEIDRQAGVIRGVKVLGLESKNGRTYLPEALSQAVSLYEGAKVNVNHAKGAPFGPRDYQDRLGAIRAARFHPGQGLFGDLHFNPKHALAEQLLWDAEHAPENVGLSHNVQARTSLKEGRTIVEGIAMVHSVDLVADPATTQGLFEEASAAPQAFAQATPVERFWSELTADTLRERRPDLVEALAQTDRCENRRLREELDRLRAREALTERKALVDSLLEDYGLPLPQPHHEHPIVSRRFVESLMLAPDEQTVRALILERVALVREARASQSRWTSFLGQPRSRDQLLAEHGSGIQTTDDFVRAIT
jgi:hypothetical protein